MININPNIVKRISLDLKEIKSDLSVIITNNTSETKFRYSCSTTQEYLPNFEIDTFF